MLTKDEAICIRTVDYSETSQVVTFFARITGKFSAIAKGSRRAKSSFDGPIEMFACGTIVFSASGTDKLATLTEFQQRPLLSSAAMDMSAYNCCLFAAEMVNLFTRDYDPHPFLFDCLKQFLQAVGSGKQQKHDLIALLVVFQLALLKEAGVSPVFGNCINCKRDGVAGWRQVYFSSAGNGVICPDCEPSFPDRIRLSRPAAGALADLKTLAHCEPKTLNEIEKILIRYITHTLGRPLKMAKHIV